VCFGIAKATGYVRLFPFGENGTLRTQEWAREASLRPIIKLGVWFPCFSKGQGAVTDPSGVFPLSSSNDAIVIRGAADP